MVRSALPPRPSSSHNGRSAASFAALPPGISPSFSASATSSGLPKTPAVAFSHGPWNTRHEPLARSPQPVTLTPPPTLFLSIVSTLFPSHQERNRLSRYQTSQLQSLHALTSQFAVHPGGGPRLSHPAADSMEQSWGSLVFTSTDRFDASASLPHPAKPAFSIEAALWRIWAFGPELDARGRIPLAD